MFSAIGIGVASAFAAYQAERHREKLKQDNCVIITKEILLCEVRSWNLPVEYCDTAYSLDPQPGIQIAFVTRDAFCAWNVPDTDLTLSLDEIRAKHEPAIRRTLIEHDISTDTKLRAQIERLERQNSALRAVAEAVVEEHDKLVGMEGPSWDLTEKAMDALRWNES